MTDIKTIVSGDLKDRLEQKVLTGKAPKKGGVLLPKYEAFAKVFGQDNFGFVTIDDLRSQMKSGKPAPVMKLNENFMPYWDGETGIASEVLFASSFKLGNGRFVSEQSFREILDYLETQERLGNISYVLNSKRSNLFKDKAAYINLREQRIPIPRTWHFNNFNELSCLVNEDNGSYIFKPRFGFDGTDVERFNSSNFGKLFKKNISDYVVQDEIDIVSESRLIFCDGDFLGARMIEDRTRPWETKKKSRRLHKISSYLPSKEEIKDSKDIIKYSDTYLGCVDWIYDSKGERFFLEMNGTAVGLGKSGGIYNLNEIVANKIKDKYLK